MSKTLTYNLADDYSHGIIAWDCKNNEDKKNIADKLTSIALIINANLAGQEMNKQFLDELILILQQLETQANNIKNIYINKEIPSHLDFIVTHINENIVPGLSGYISQAKMIEMLKESEEVDPFLQTR